MAINMVALKAYVGGSSTDDALLSDCLLQAETLVNHYIGSNVVPSSIYDLAVIRVAADLFNARQAPNGIANAQFALSNGDLGGQAVRISRDPMKAATALLGRWVSPW